MYRFFPSPIFACQLRCVFLGPGIGIFILYKGLGPRQMALAQGWLFDFFRVCGARAPPKLGARGAREACVVAMGVFSVVVGGWGGRGAPNEFGRGRLGPAPAEKNANSFTQIRAICARPSGSHSFKEH